VNEDIDYTLPCGLRLLVIALPEGIGSGKVHQGEFLWSVEVGAATHARGYALEHADAKARMVEAARRVLAQSKTVLDALEQP
jgi:hypothetical protein